jgi:alpha-1,2-mannosyltransferase
VTRSRLRCLVVIVAGLVLVNLLLWRIGHTTTLRYTRMLLIQQASADSWRPMVRALEAWDAGRPIYQTVFFEQHVKFQYPPSSLLLPLAVRSEQRTGDPLFFALNDIGLAATLLLVGCVLFLFLRTWQTDRSQSGLVRLWAGAAIVGIGALMYFPVTISYVLGQIQTMVNAAVGVALVCWLLGWRVAAGIAIGVACLVKPHFALVGIWGATRRRWSFVAAVTATAAVGVLASVVAFGWAEQAAYTRVLAFIGERGEALYANQTVNGLLNRLVQPPEHREWDFHSYPPPHPVVLAGTIATSVLLLAAAVWLPRRLRFAGTPLDLAVACLSVTMASPIAWDHHYGGLLPILVLAGGLSGRHDVAVPRWVPPALAVAFVVTANLWEPLIDVGDPPANIVQAYVLAGALIALAALYRLGRATAAGDGGVGD